MWCVCVYVVAVYVARGACVYSTTLNNMCVYMQWRFESHLFIYVCQILGQFCRNQGPYANRIVLLDVTDQPFSQDRTNPKEYPTVWVCRCKKFCMKVFDVSNKNDPQRNDHLSLHMTHTDHDLERSVEKAACTKPAWTLVYSDVSPCTMKIPGCVCCPVLP